MDKHQIALVEEISRRYLWWQAAEGAQHSPARMLAQIMNLGTYDDIRRIEAVFDPSDLAKVLADAEPGWFSARSWAFWKGRLSMSAGQTIQEEPPKRSFSRAALF